MNKYRKKPVVIEAIELKNTQESILECLNFIGDNTSLTTRQTFEEGIFIGTLEGTHLASFGDYIIKGVQGEFYPCKPDIFKQTYEKVEE